MPIEGGGGCYLHYPYHHHHHHYYYHHQYHRHHHHQRQHKTQLVKSPIFIVKPDWPPIEFEAPLKASSAFFCSKKLLGLGKKCPKKLLDLGKKLISQKLLLWIKKMLPVRADHKDHQTQRMMYVWASRLVDQDCSSMHCNVL